MTVNEGHTAEITCNLFLGLEGGQTVTWKWEEVDISNLNYTIISPNNLIEIKNSESGDQSTLTLKEVGKTKRGNYRCTAENSFGTASHNILLRVKG